MKFDDPQHKDLIRRYLVWAYKSTKESFDRLERKTTQLAADDFIAKTLASMPRKGIRSTSEYKELLKGYDDYIVKKKETVIPQAQYQYLKDRLEAVESAIIYFCGKPALRQIQTAYEQEFTRRIWESRDH